MSEDQLHDAQDKVEQALTEAKRVTDRGMKLAEGWRKSRTDNNFRMMIRQRLGGQGSGA